MDALPQIVLNALIAGSIYALITLGFNLLYSTTRFFDLSYGAIAALGGYIVYYLYNLIGIDLYVAIALGILGAGALAFVIERVLYRPLRKRKATSAVLLIASLGVLLVIQSALAILFTSQFHILTRDLSAERVFSFFGAAITEVQVVILVGSLVIALGLGALLRYTRFGKAVQAIADDEEVANVVGIDSEKMIGIVYFIGGATAGAAGIATGFDTGIMPTLGLAILLKGVIAAIVGGIGNVYGGVVGAFVLAAIENTGAWYFSAEWRDTIAFLVLIAFLLLRPKGILPK